MASGASPATDADSGALKRYTFGGLTLETTLRLRTLSPAAGSSPEGVILRVGLGTDDAPVEEELWTSPLDVETPYITASRTARGLRLRFAELATFDMALDGSRITCSADPGVELASLEQLLVDQVLPKALHLAGRPCLHGSALVLPDGRALALVGPSGSGKSTLCGALCDRGASMLCDDALGLEPRGDQVFAHPGYPSVRLWPDSAEALAPTTLPRAAPHTDKRRLTRPVASAPAPLAALLVVAPDDGQERLALVALDSGTAVTEIAPQVHRIDPEARDAMRAEFEALGALVAGVQVSRLHYPRRYDRLGEVAEFLLAL